MPFEGGAGTGNPFELRLFGRPVTNRRNVVIWAPAAVQLGLTLVQIPWLVVVDTCRLSKHDQQDPSKTSFTAVAKRIWENHGLGGFYRGVIPSLCGVVLAGATLLATQKLIGWPEGLPLTYTLKTQLMQLAISAIFMPLEIMMYRILLLPDNLSIWTPLQNLKRVLTPAERHSPLKTIYHPRNILAYMIPAIPPMVLETYVLPILGRYCSSRSTMLATSAVLYGAVYVLLGTPLAVAKARTLASAPDVNVNLAEKLELQEQSGFEKRPVYAPQQERFPQFTQLREEGGASLLYKGWLMELFVGQQAWRDALGLPILSQMYNNRTL